MTRQKAVPDPDSPLVVTLGSIDHDPRRARLADVLVATAGDRPGSEFSAELLARYPGLALAVVVESADRITSRVRDGDPVGMRYVPPPPAMSAVMFRMLACYLYGFWLAGSQLAELAGVWLTMSSHGTVELVELPNQIPRPE